jgi:hypothetical protein
VVLVAVAMVDGTLKAHQILMGNQHLRTLVLVVVVQDILHQPKQLLDLVDLDLFLSLIQPDKYLKT